MWSLFEVVAKPKLQCNLVLKRFLGRLLREIYRVSEPTDINNFYYNAKIKLSSSTINEMELFMNGEDDWRPEALDEALSGILVEVTPVVTSFDNMFGVDFVPLIIGFFSIIILIMALIMTWLRISWLKCFVTTFAISFFVSIPWNWLYLYKEAYAKHQSKFMKVEITYQECMRLQNLSWFGSLREWFRTTWTFKRDPCEEYRKIFLIDPFHEVPPIKAFVYTLTTFIIEPLRALGEGMGVFFQELLKDLPFITWTPVLIVITIVSLGALMLGLPVFCEQARRFLPLSDRNQGRNANTQAPNQLQNDNVRLEQIVIHQSQPNGTKEEINIQFLRSAGRPHIEEVPHVEGRQGSTEGRNNISVKYNFEDQQEIQEEVRFSSVTPTDQPKGSQPKLDYPQAKNKKVKAEKKGSYDEPCGDGAPPAPQAYRRKGFSIPEIHSENVSAQKI